MCFVLLPLGSAQAQMSDLIGMLTSQLGVTEKQAQGGAGSLFKFAQDQLSPSEFSTVESSLPGVDGLVAQAPDVGGSSLLGGGSSLLGGSAGNLAGLETLTKSFDQLGMSPDMIQKFVPIISKYAEQVGGPEIAELLTTALSP